MRNEIGEIRRALEARFGSRYSQVAVAARVGVPKNTLSRWELGLLEPRVTKALALARDLGVTVEQLGFREDPPDHRCSS